MREIKYAFTKVGGSARKLVEYMVTDAEGQGEDIAGRVKARAREIGSTTPPPALNLRLDSS